jgi:WD40 repeat protein
MTQTSTTELAELLQRLTFIAFTQALGEPDLLVYEQELRQTAAQTKDLTLHHFLHNYTTQISKGGPETFLSLLLAHPTLGPPSEALAQEWAKPLLQPDPSLLHDHKAHHRERVGCILPIADGSWLSASWDSSLKLWSPTQSGCLQTWNGYIEVTSMISHSSKPVIYFTASDAAIWSWRLEDRKPSRFVYHQKRPLCVLFVSQPEMLLSAGDDRVIYCWSTKGKLLNTLEGHVSSVVSLALLPGQRTLLSASYDCTLKLWDLNTGQCLATFQGDKDHLTQLQLHPDGTKVFLGTQEKSIRLLDLKNGQELYKIPGVGSAVSSMSLSFDGRWLVVAFYDGSLRVFDVQQATYIARFVAPDTLSACRFLSNHQIAAGDINGKTWLFTLRLPV